MNSTGGRPATRCAAQSRTVSVIWPLFITTEMPRASPTTSATPSRSRAPSTKPPVSSCSPIRPAKPMMMAKRRNSAVSSGNHHPSVGRAVMPRSLQGMTL